MTAAYLKQWQRGYSEHEVQIARRTVSEFVLHQAEQTKGDVGFGWVAQAEAPSKFGDLRAAFAESARSGQPLPVSNDNSASVVFIDSSVNFAMRFWHDVNHVRRGLTFELVDELELSLWHLSVLQAAGFATDSLVWQLLHADLIGQIYVMSLTQRFPLDQRRFVEGCVGGGFDQAVLDEARRVPS